MEDPEDREGPYEGYDRSKYLVGPGGLRVFRIEAMTPDRESYRSLTEEEREEFDSLYLRSGCSAPRAKPPVPPAPVEFPDFDPYEGYDPRRYCVGPGGRNV